MATAVFSLAQRLLLHGGGGTSELSYILTMDSLLSLGSTVHTGHFLALTALRNCPTKPYGCKSYMNLGITYTSSPARLEPGTITEHKHHLRLYCDLPVIPLGPCPQPVPHSLCLLSFPGRPPPARGAPLFRQSEPGGAALTCTAWPSPSRTA